MKKPSALCLRIAAGLTFVAVKLRAAQEPLQPSSAPEAPMRVAFASSHHPAERIDIFEINADGSGLHLLTRPHRSGRINPISFLGKLRRVIVPTCWFLGGSADL
jgi:hypothetical protein